MSMILETARKSSLRTLRGNDPRERALNVIVMRLLTIALSMTSSGPPQHLVRRPLPTRYHTWPMAESEFESHSRRRRVRFYVCPNAAILSNDDPFPVGTILVVETTSLDETEASPPTRWVMRKYVGATTGRPNRASYGAWTVADYGSSRVVPFEHDSVCGLCREL